MKQQQVAIFILLIAILAISIFYQYPAIFQMQPQGAHLWRQSDCMAMTQNYQQFHLPFLQPATYNLQSTNGSVAGEFPLFYYIAAQFSNTVFALRLMHTFIFFCGIISIYFIAFYFLHHYILSIFCSVLIFTSPLLVFYGNNFLSDVPALSLAFIGWAIFLYHYKKENLAMMFLACLCFVFAVLLKASEAINVIIAFIFLYKIRKLSIKNSIPFLLLIIPFVWYLYAKSYNKINHDSYYFLSVFPIWKLRIYDIGLGAWRIVISNSKSYFWLPTSILLIASIYFLITRKNELNNEIGILIISSFIVTIIYIILFYQKMIAHEYYYILFYIFVIFCIIGILKIYSSRYNKSVFAQIAIYLFLAANIIYCKKNIVEKFTMPIPNGYLSSAEMQRVLLWHGIKYDKIIISLPDETPNQTLYQLKRKGYTSYNNYDAVLKNKKADFLIVSVDFINQNKIQIQPYLKDSIGYFNGFYFYKLR